MIDLFELPLTPCVYKWTNKINGKIYIGETVNMLVRLKKYYRDVDADRGMNMRINRAFKKYGFESFDLQILEVYPSRHNSIKTVLLERETFWIKLYQSNNSLVGYNLILNGRSVLCARTPKERGRRSNENIKNPMKGKKHTEETKLLISKRNRGLKWTPERREQASKARSGGPNKSTERKIHQINPISGEIVATYESIKIAGVALGNKNKATRICMALSKKV